MGGIAVVHNLDGRPADPTLIDRILTAMAHRGPDGRGRWIGGSAALGHLAFHTTPESRGHAQPIVDSEAGLALAFDGRIDNRDELADALRSRGSCAVRGDDAELALRAWQCWSEGALERIEGDFAFALWDERKRGLFCARDHSGIVPLYYYCDGATFLAASELHALFECPSIPREPNEGFIGEYLTGYLYNRTETLYQRIMRLEPAHMLAVHRGAATPRRYFDLVPDNPIRYSDDREYADHFRAIFGEAVRRRLRTITPVGCELSGGLDSTSVAGMALRMIRDGAAVVPGFETLSSIFSERHADERVYSDEAARFWAVKHNRVPGGAVDLSSYIETIRRYRDFPGYPTSAAAHAPKLLAREKGIRVILSGVGGDQWMSGTEYYYAELIRQGRLRELIGLLARADGSARHKLLRLAKRGLWPLIPEATRRTVMAHVLRRQPFPSTIRSEFARRIDLAGRIARSEKQPRGMSFGDAAIKEAFDFPFSAHGFEIANRDASARRIEERHPFYDIRLIRFCMNIPDEQRWRPGSTKYVLRESMRGLIPELVRQRISKAFFDEVFARTLQNSDARKRFERMRLEELGWVDGDEVRRVCAEFLANPEAFGPFPLWNAFAMELWINEIFGRDERRADDARAMARRFGSS